MNTNKKLLLVTHSLRFHADDIFACATLSLMLEKEGSEFEIVRTRDENIIAKGDYVFDIGGIYDPKLQKFDHHQKGGAGTRENGMPYAACGLVWKAYGDILTGDPEITRKLDQKLFQSIDADDNGVATFTQTGDVSPYLIQTMLYSFRTTWKEDENKLDSIFLELVLFAEKILTREIIQAKDAKEASTKVIDAYNIAEDKRLIVFEKSIPAEDILIHYPEPLYIVRPNSDGSWRAIGVSVEHHSFERRKPFPEEWAGLRDEELQKVSGVSDATFCHNGRWLVVAKSKEGILALAQKALQR